MTSTPVPTSCPGCTFGGFDGIRCLACDYSTKPRHYSETRGITPDEMYRQLAELRSDIAQLQTRGRTPQQALLDVLAWRWPKKPLTTRQKLVALEKARWAIERE